MITSLLSQKKILEGVLRAHFGYLPGPAILAAFSGSAGIINSQTNGLNIAGQTFTSWNGRNHDAERKQLAMRGHHSLRQDISFVASERIACQKALAVSSCYCLFDRLMVHLMFGTSSTPTAIFAPCVIISSTKALLVILRQRKHVENPSQQASLKKSIFLP